MSRKVRVVNDPKYSSLMRLVYVKSRLESAVKLASVANPYIHLPGTGKKIEPSLTDVHLLVIGVHMATSEGGRIVLGIFQRILPFEGFDRMRGEEEKYAQKEATPETAASFWIIYRDTLLNFLL
jgi:hypothetical protein